MDTKQNPSEQIILGGNRIGRSSGFAQHRAGVLHRMLPTLPLGFNTKLIQKRSFDYELIGGM